MTDTPPTSMGEGTKQAQGIVAFSFGKRAASEEPNPSNRVLADAVTGAAEANPNSIVVAQWEIARGVRAEGGRVDVVVNPRADGSYLSTDDVWATARDRFRRDGVTVVTPVAHPFLHLSMIKRMIEADGFEITVPDLRSVPFDRSSHNTQWWTKGRSRLIVYAVMRLFHRGK